MPRNRVCCVCGDREADLSTGNSRSFFSFPKIDKRLTNPTEVELLQRRIAAWKNIVGKNINIYYGTPTVCSKHFHSGKPSYAFLEKDIDWIPSKNLGNLEQNKEPQNNSSDDAPLSNSSNMPSSKGNILHSCDQTMHVDHTMLNSPLANDCNSTNPTPCAGEENTVTMSDDARINPMHSVQKKSVHASREKCISEISNLISLLKNVGILNPEEKTIRDMILDLDKLHSPTEKTGASKENVASSGVSATENMNHTVQGSNVTADQMASMVKESVKMQETIVSLEDLLRNEKELLKNEKLINRIRGNDKMTKFYTGLKSWMLFEILYNLVLPGIEFCSAPSKRSLPTEEQFLLVLMKLRLNLPDKDLAFRFHMSQNTVSTYLSKWIDVMYCRLARNFMIWPTKATLDKSTPTTFPGIVSIINYFEIPLDGFFNLLGRATTHSRNNLKYFISITPTGSISYISQGYSEERATDVQITLDSKKNMVVLNDETFLNKLKEGDVVLADRGFLVELEVKKRGAILRTPSFADRRSRLTQQETLYSRKVSKLRIHAEKVIGELRRTFKILTDCVPYTGVRSEEEKLLFFDKVVFVCCCLNNANPVASSIHAAFG